MIQAMVAHLNDDFLIKIEFWQKFALFPFQLNFLTSCDPCT